MLSFTKSIISLLSLIILYGKLAIFPTWKLTVGASKDKNLKSEMIKIESSCKSARLIDIDVYFNQSCSLNRSSPRKCYICNQPALICSKTQKHSKEELLNHIEKITSSHLRRIIKKIRIVLWN